MNTPHTFRKKFLFFFLACIACGAALFVQVHQPINEHDEQENSAPNASTQFMGAQREYPDGNFSLRSVELAYQQWRNNSETKLLSPDTSWRSIGPTNLAGRVLSVAINFENPTEIWVGTATGGLWKLIDSGTSYRWTPIETGFPTQSVGAIYIDSADRNLIFIGTGEVYSYLRTGAPGTGERTLRGFYGTGIYRSADGGATWAQVLSFPDSSITAVNKIIANPTHTRSLYAATTQGVYKSDDQGFSWRLLNLPEMMAMDLVINRIDTTNLFVACGDQDAENPGIYRTTDAGNNWSQLKVVASAYSGRSALAIDATNPKIVFAGISDKFGAQGLYRSSNGGDNWTLQSTADWTQTQGWYANVVEINPLYFFEVLCGGIKLWKSSSNGSPITAIDNIQKNYHVDIHAITFQRSDPNLRTFYIGTDGGIFKTTDDGLSFSDMNTGFVTTQFYNGFANAMNDSVLAMGGLQDNGTYIYSGSTAWQNVYLGDGSWCAIAPTNPSIMLAQYAYISGVNPAQSGVVLQRTTNGGASFAQVLVDTSGPCSFTTPIVTAHSGHTMYCGTSVIFKSTNDGATWTVPSHDTLDQFILGANPCIALAVARSSADTVYAATAPITHAPGIFASFDGGSTWKNIFASNLPNRYPTSLAVDAYHAQTVYATFSGFNAGHIFRTTNAGASWSDITHNLPDLPTNAVLPDPIDSGIVYVGNDLGVYVSTDAGASWQNFTKGMPAAVVTAITITEPGRTLRVATHGRGVYERAAIESRVAVDEQIAPQMQSLRIYPTVVQRGDALTIAFSTDARVQGVMIFDDAGNRVYEKYFSGREIISGASTIALSAAGLRSGSYIVRIISGGQYFPARFVVIK